MAIPIVAVVGRPNVGKSTLFNKLIGQRLSIVEDTPGVTRDRIYSKCEWRGKEFMVVDTGGIEPDSDDVILAQMRRQSELAIEKADVIVFVTDIRCGVTADDQTVAQMLLKSGKPVILAVNKVDNLGEPPMELYEFYNLGLGEPYPISSVHGHGTGDMLDAVYEYLPDEHDEDYDDDMIKVAVIGKPNAGKSSLINKIAGEERVIVSDVAGTTRDSTDTVIENEFGKFVFIDTAGIRETNDLVEQMGIERTYDKIKEAEIVMWVFDATRFQKQYDELSSTLMPFLADKKLIIVLNKMDLLEEERAEALAQETKQHNAESNSAIQICAHAEADISRLKQLLLNTVSSIISKESSSDVIVSNARHYESLSLASESLRRVVEGIKSNLSGDFISQDLRECIYHLGEIVGKISSDDVLHNIFSKFCVGK